jgi:ParB family chromosome partitioning protein
MAKRRRLDAPDAAEVARHAQRFAADRPLTPALGPTAPPIARVAAEASERAAAEVVEARRAAAEHEADAGRWRAALADGRAALSIPLAAIEAEHLSRDRLALDDAELAELKASIRTHGLRMPIEVLALPASGGAPRFGLISGWRRLQALRALRAETGEDRFSRAKALVRDPRDASEAYVAMVEENEIRADLSHYERGRIAAVAAGQGAFASVEAAVDVLFGAGSRAKRSKIRSFAQLHEALGDLLRFGPALSERAGLRLAQALRAAGAPALRRALASAGARTAEAEWRALEPVVLAVERDEGRVARPRTGRPPERERRRLAGGIVLEIARREGEASLRLLGPGLGEEILDDLAREAERLIGSER